MRLPIDNKDGYHRCSILNQNLENIKDKQVRSFIFKKSVNNFILKQYTIIAGTADDNVHFQNAAQISKAFIGVGAEIKAQVIFFFSIMIKTIIVLRFNSLV